MSERSTKHRQADSGEQLDHGQLRGLIERASGQLRAFRQDIVPYLEREAEHLHKDLEILAKWTSDFEHDGVEALAGASVVVTTALKRVAYFEQQLGEADTGLTKRLEALDETIEEIDGRIQNLDISRVVYVTYVNRSFVARYVDPSVEIGKILEDAGRDDVDELGLYPLDDQFGNAIPDLAFPASRTVDLRDDHRVYWESESDGGSIA